jgi:hypothetical protein
MRRLRLSYAKKYGALTWIDFERRCNFIRINRIRLVLDHKLERVPATTLCPHPLSIQGRGRWIFHFLYSVSGE